MERHTGQGTCLCSVAAALGALDWHDSYRLCSGAFSASAKGRMPRLTMWLRAH